MIYQSMISLKQSWYAIIYNGMVSLKQPLYTMKYNIIIVYFRITWYGLIKTTMID